MNIYLVKEPRAEKEKITLEKGTSAEEIYKRYRGQLPYTIRSRTWATNSIKNAAPSSST